MSAYTPSGAEIVIVGGVTLVATLLLALGVSRLRPGPRARAAWLLVIVATALAERVTRDEPAGIRMLGIISVRAEVLVENPHLAGRWHRGVEASAGTPAREDRDHGPEPRSAFGCGRCMQRLC